MRLYSEFYQGVLAQSAGGGVEGGGDIGGGVILVRGDLCEGKGDAAGAGQAQVSVLLGSFHTVWVPAMGAGGCGDVGQVQLWVCGVFLTTALLYRQREVNLVLLFILIIT